MVKKLIERLKYPHKWSALRYFIDDPRLVYGVPSTPTRAHVASFIERATGSNIVAGLHHFLPQRFLDHYRCNGGTDSQGYRLMLYLLVRKFKPEVVVETGVARGVSSGYILQAMEDNAKGHLYSIDLPPQTAAVEDDEKRKDYRFELADGQRHKHYEVGHIVPDYLRHRWTLELDDARKALPMLLNKLEKIDFFYHDSLHTHDHMKFEFDAAWPHLNDGGLLLSDDVLWNHAFHDICRQYRRRPIIYRSFAMIQK